MLVVILVVLAIILVLVLLEKNTGGEKGGMGCVSFAVVVVVAAFMMNDCAHQADLRNQGKARPEMKRAMQVGTVTDLVVSTNKYAGPYLTEFPDTTAVIVVNGKLNGARPGCEVKASWYFVPASAPPRELGAESCYAPTGNDPVAFSARRPSTNWVKGQYRVEITINNVPVATTTFGVVADPSAGPMNQPPSSQDVPSTNHPVEQSPREKQSEEYHDYYKRMFDPND